VSLSSLKALFAGIVGVVIGIAFLAKGVFAMGIPAVLLGGALLWLALRPAGRKPRPGETVIAPVGKVGDLILLEVAGDGGVSPFWLAKVAEVDRQGLVTAVTTYQGLIFDMKMLRPRLKSAQICSATHFDVPDAMRREKERQDANQRWTSREEVIALLRPASTAF